MKLWSFLLLLTITLQHSSSIESKPSSTPTNSASAKSVIKKNVSLPKPSKKSPVSNASKKAVSNEGDDGDGNLWKNILKRLEITAYFALWYALNVVYNILNKQVLNILPAPVTIGSIQLGVGSLYCVLLWIFHLRSTPSLTAEGHSITNRIGFYHSTGQLLSMISLGAGPVSFTHIVKALEPFFSACVSALVFGKRMKWQVYVTLIPVVTGVGYACLKERSFSWLAFSTAMLSNLAFALRAAVSKSAMGRDIGQHLSSTNLFGIVTSYAFFISIPFALLAEGLELLHHWIKALDQHRSLDLCRSIVISGMFHYLNNEVMYLALSNVHPVTLAVGNTMKRVFIILASVIVFRNPVSLQAGIGSAVGIAGVLLYSLTKQHYEKLELMESQANAKK